ncbi:MAG: hypothetical protein J6I57_09590 [Desulfovibrio sp.]|nr:hypothetical protein [Desulfovibrio sp.]
MTDDLPPRLTTDLFRTASGARLQEIYRTLFHRMAEREDELHVFTDGGFSPRRVLDVLDDLEHHWPDPRVRPPLFGVPVGVKDLYRTAGYAIHAGSLLPASCFRGPEADIVTALKKLGCVVMGITQSSEFAGAAPASTCNPLNPRHTPGGSSSGSAAGVAAGYFPLALGTQTKGVRGAPSLLLRRHRRETRPGHSLHGRHRAFLRIRGPAGFLLQQHVRCRSRARRPGRP